jgi:hypothetical protein
MHNRVLAGIVGVAIALTQQFTPAFAATAVTGPHGEILRVTKATAIKSGDAIVVSGQHFDETVGIYVAMCKVVSKGQLPTPCGGGADKTGTEGASEWISSNPPTYGVGLAKPYLPGGRFSVTVKVSPIIPVPKGKAIDCRKVACAIYTRADHTRGDDRLYDIALPLQFKK